MTKRKLTPARSKDPAHNKKPAGDDDPAGQADPALATRAATDGAAKDSLPDITGPRGNAILPDNSGLPETPPLPDGLPDTMPNDEQLRRLAAVRLAEHLDRGASLIARCQRLAQSQRGDQLGPLYAAARLMRADAGVAQALAHVVMVERRSRTIIEQIQKPDPKQAELNAYLQKKQKDDENRKTIQRQLQEKVAWVIRREKAELAEHAKWNQEHGNQNGGPGKQPTETNHDDA